MDSEQTIHQLQAQVAALTAEVRALRSAAPATGVETDPTAGRVTSRRNVLKLAGAAAVGSAAAFAARGGSVAAADGDPVRAGQSVATTPSSESTTVLEYTNTVAPSVTYNGNEVPANLLLVRDVPNTSSFNPDGSSSFPAAVAGYAFPTVPNRQYGNTQRQGYGVVGFGAVAGSVGVLAQGAKANLELRPGGTAPSARVDSHSVGEIVVDTDSSVWVCVAAGVPGTWRKLAGPASAGTFHPLAPSRVYDSRAPQPQIGALTSGQNRTISVASRRDTLSGAVTAADIVPPGATAIAVNVTVVNTVAGGFVTLNPGGTTTVEGASVNWSATGQILNNGIIARLDADRQVTAVVGGTATTRADVVLDVTGYFL